MTTAEYAFIQLPATPVILGLALRPLSIGQALWLERVGSAFSWDGIRSRASGVRKAGLGDLLLALEICRRGDLSLPTPRELRRLGARHRKLSPAARRAAGDELALHVLDAFQAPACWRETEGEDRDSGVPLLAALQIGLMARLHLSEAVALRTPVRLALQFLAALNALEGRLDLITDQDRAMMQLATAGADRHGDTEARR